MTDDATLTDFCSSAAADETEDAPPSDESEAPDELEDPAAKRDESDETDGADEADKANKADETSDSGLSTYAWGSYACARCGSETDRVWRADDEFVCPDCKSW